MNLPVMPPVSPMLAKLTRELPDAAEVLYEPKWDGFRAIVYRDGNEVEIGSRGEKSFTRYFPELLDPLRATLPGRCVVDGEIVVPGPQGLDFGLLQMRIHPADSRVDRLSRETPAEYVAFDLLALGHRDLRREPLAERRRLLEQVLAQARPPVHVTPASTDRAVAADWLERFDGRGLDGVMVKPLDLRYLEGKRAMTKVKRERTADCVVAGYRLHKDGQGVGSLLLGLHDHEVSLHHVGVATGFSEARRTELLDELAPLRLTSYEGHPWERWQEPDAHERQLLPGTPSRWRGARAEDAAWEPLAPERVAEVAYDQIQGARFRASTRFLRWRPDRDPGSCTFAQLVTRPPDELTRLFSRSQTPR